MVVIAMRATLAAVLARGRDGVLAGLARGAMSVDMSTSDARPRSRCRARSRKRGARFVDAPVSGTVGPAGRGELVALVGPRRSGDAKRAEPMFRAICKRWIRAGAVGQGQALKVS